MMVISRCLVRNLFECDNLGLIHAILDVKGESPQPDCHRESDEV